MEPSSQHLHVAWRIQGRVQGVGFRWWALRTAERLELRGTVRNAPDGSVEIVAAGTAEAIDAFADLLSTGPPSARVDDILALPAAGPVPADFRVIA